MNAPFAAMPPLIPFVLDIERLSTAFPGRDGAIPVVDEVTLQVAAGKTLAVVGESGSGKSMTFRSALGLVAAPGKVIGGHVRLAGVDLTRLSGNALRRLRGNAISMIFQDPLTALNPVFTIGHQIATVLRAHTRATRGEAHARAIELLRRVRIPEPERRVNDYPHQLSGGMRQRVMIAMAVALRPKVLIADEPTTALDVTVQAQILDLLADLQQETGMALVLITHDLGLVARYADSVAVMYGGRVVENGARDDIFAQPRHPYTRALFESIPRLDAAQGNALPVVDGTPPDLAALPRGCAFEPRCPLGRGREDCRTQRPPLATAGHEGHRSACLHWPSLVAPASPAVRA